MRLVVKALLLSVYPRLSAFNSRSKKCLFVIVFVGMGLVVGASSYVWVVGWVGFLFWVVFLFVLGWAAWFLSLVGMLGVCWVGWDEDG
jgi:hypothetical protein